MEYPAGYARPEYLVTPERLAEQQERAEVLIVDTRPRDEYEKGHIPGALHHDPFPHHLYDTSPEGMAGFHRSMEGIFSGLGVRPRQTVVFYEDLSGMRAARCLWILEYLGHDRVKLLDGGLSAWKGKELPMERTVPRVAEGSFQGKPREPLVATYRDVLDRLHNPEAVILDVRRESEYRGAEVRAARGGAIPGAVHLEWTENLNGDGTLKPAAELRALYESRGVTPDREIIPYCHGGYRSANTYLALKLLGYPRVRNYVSSWGEWGNRPDLPVEIP